MAVTIKIDVKKLVKNISEKIDGLEISRVVAVGMQGVVKNRIHVDGQAADGKQIGVYSKGYLALRTGNYKNSDKVTKGKKAGELKNAGKFSKGSKAGAARPKYNRTSDPKVILSLTRQMENDFSVIALGVGFGLGYKNKFNFDKARWAEKNYKKKIFNLTADERVTATAIAQRELSKQLGNAE